MKKIAFLCTLLFVSLMSSASISIRSIEPAFWYVGMKDARLQLMVSGSNIREASVTTDYPGARIDSLVRLDSPNYLLIYLHLDEAKAGQMSLVFTQGKSKKTVNYLLRNRKKSGEERWGFSNADVLYMLMPDRFANGRPENDQLRRMKSYTVDRTQPSLRHGGDLEGVRQHLDYLADLGVTAIWLTPVLENNSPDYRPKEGAPSSTYHGYATTDYYRVDPRFGTNEEYRRLVDEAHSKGLKVVMDMIFNHCGLDHPWVADMPSRDWFNVPEWLQKKGDEAKKLYLQTSYKLTPVLDPYASEVDRRETTDGWFVSTMPDLNQRNPHVMTYLIQNAMWWVETIGIDGIRMDTYPYADREAMAKWMKRMEEEYPHFNTVGETWVSEPAYTAAWQMNSRLTDVNSYLKTVMDFSFYDKINKAKTEQTDAWDNGYNRVYNSLCYDYLYPNPASVMAFLDNHDTDRFLDNGQGVETLQQAMALLLTIQRIPQIYYGTEILMSGNKRVTDGNVRRDFPGGWAADKANAFTAEGRTPAQQSMFTWLRRLLHWRKGNEVVTRGRQVQFVPYHGVYVVARLLEGRRVLTVINGTDTEATFHTARYAEVLGNAREAHNVLTDSAIRLSDNTGEAQATQWADVKMKPREVWVLDFEVD